MVLSVVVAVIALAIALPLIVVLFRPLMVIIGLAMCGLGGVMLWALGQVPQPNIFTWAAFFVSGAAAILGAALIRRAFAS